MTDAATTRHTAFVLGGGGVLGAVEVGMLRALLEAGITPDLIVGTSIGALNGALLATEPSLGVIERLEGLWRAAASTREVYGDRPVTQMRRAFRSRTHVFSPQPLRERLEQAPEARPLTYGQSVTDKCMDWGATDLVLRELAG